MAGWKRATRPHGPMRPFLVDGVPHIHAARVFEILGGHAPARLPYHSQPRALLEKAERDPEFQLHAVNLGRRYVWPEWEVLALKAHFDSRLMPRP
jgi:hypothetical protein